MTGASRFPARTLALVLIALAASLMPALERLFVLERSAVLGGEIWRLLTGHLVHGDLRLALFDLGALLVLGATLEATRPRLLVPALLVSGVASSLAVLVLRPDILRYEGSSALSSALFVALGITLLRSEARWVAALAALSILSFAAKVLLEASGAWPALALSTTSSHEVLASAHLVGGLSGLALAVGRPRRLEAPMVEAGRDQASKIVTV